MSTPTPLPSGPRHYPRLKFIWGSSDVIAGHWQLGLFAFYTRRRGYRFSGLAISVRGLLRWALVLGAVSYLAGAFALTRWLQRNPYNRLHYVDVVSWPLRRERVARMRAAGWLAQGKDAMRQQRWSDAVFYLRRGLEVCPEDHEARLALAQFYLLAGQRTKALALMVDGLDPRWPLPSRAILEGEMDVAFAGEDWATARQLCDRGLPRLGRPEQWVFRQWLLGRKLAILLATDRAPEALALAEAEGDPADVAVKFQWARALVALGRTSEAIAGLRRWRKGLDADTAPVLLRLETTLLREAGLLDDMERDLAELRALQPLLPNPLAFAVEERARAGRGAAAALEEFLFRFGRSGSDLALVSQPLARIPDLALLRRVAEAAKERGFPGRPFLVQLAEAQLRQGDWRGAAQTVDALAPQFAGATPAARLWYEWMSCLVASLSAGQAASAQPIVAYLQGHLLSLEAYQLTTSALRRAGRDEVARDVIALGRKLYAESPSLAAQQAEVEAALAARPPPPLLPGKAPPAIALPVSADEFFRELEACVAGRRWREAAELVHAARNATPPPAWLAAGEAEILRQEIRVGQGEGRLAETRAEVRLYLNGTSARADAMLALARAWQAAGARADARLLATWVVAANPDHAEAKRMLREWQAAEGR